MSSRDIHAFPLDDAVDYVSPSLTTYPDVLENLPSKRPVTKIHLIGEGRLKTRCIGAMLLYRPSKDIYSGVAFIETPESQDADQMNPPVPVIVAQGPSRNSKDKSGADVCRRLTEEAFVSYEPVMRKINGRWSFEGCLFERTSPEGRPKDPVPFKITTDLPIADPSAPFLCADEFPFRRGRMLVDLGMDEYKYAILELA